MTRAGGSARGQGGIERGGRASSRWVLLVILLLAALGGLAPGSPDAGKRAAASRLKGIERIDGTNLIRVDSIEPGGKRGIVLKGHFRKLKVLPKGEVERSIEVLTDAIREIEGRPAKTETDHHVDQMMLKSATRDLEALKKHGASSLDFTRIMGVVVAGGGRPSTSEYTKSFPSFAFNIKLSPLAEGQEAEFTVDLPANLEPGDYTVFLRPRDTTSVFGFAIPGGSDTVTLHVPLRQAGE